MRNHLLLSIIIVGALITTVMLGVNSSKPLPQRGVKISVSGQTGQPFTGIYVADGVTNHVDALAPAAFAFNAINVHFEFRAGSDSPNLRIDLHVGGSPRTSTASGLSGTVRGQYRCTQKQEKYWAEGF